MKKLAFILLALATIFASCSKEGPVGPEGPIGPAGPDGSIIWSGTATPPPSTTGKDGDYYFNTSTRFLYGPKTSSVWGTGILLKGDQGDQGLPGAAGSKIFTGDGTPASSLGIVGDYYLDRVNHLFYGPKFLFGSPPSAIWGGGLQLGKPALTYILSNPYTYISGSFANGSLNIPLAAFNASSSSLENDLYLAFYGSTYFFPTLYTVWYLASGHTSSYNFTASHYFSGNSGCWIKFRKADGSVWVSQAELETHTMITKIKIVKVPAGIAGSLKSGGNPETIVKELGLLED